MQPILLHLIDAEALEEIQEAQEVIRTAGGETPAERLQWMQTIFSADTTLARRATIPFSRVPAVGEYLCLPMEEDVWYRVEIVLHTPGRPSHMAEVWAIEREAG